MIWMIFLRLDLMTNGILVYAMWRYIRSDFKGIPFDFDKKQLVLTIARRAAVHPHAF